MVFPSMSLCILFTNLKELSDQCSKFLKDSAKLPQLATLFNRFLNRFGSVYTVRFDRSGKLILSSDGPGIISQLSEDTHKEISDICQILVESASEGLNGHRNSVALLNTLLSNFLRCFSFNDRSIEVKLSPERTVSVSVSSSEQGQGPRIVPLNVPGSTGGLQLSRSSGTLPGGLRIVPLAAPGSTGLLLGPGLQLSRSAGGGLMLSGKNGPGILLGSGLGLQLGNAGNSGLRSGSVSENNAQGILGGVLGNARNSGLRSNILGGQGILGGVLGNASSGLRSGILASVMLNAGKAGQNIKIGEIYNTEEALAYNKMVEVYRQLQAAEVALTTAMRESFKYRNDVKSLLNESVDFLASTYLLNFLIRWIPKNDNGAVVPYNVLRDFIIQGLPSLKVESITPVLISRIVEAMGSLFLFFGGENSSIICNASGDLTIYGFDILRTSKTLGNE